MYRYEDLRQVHLELTDKCNAACPQCPRSDHGGPVNPRLPLTELTLDDIKTILPPSLICQLRSLYACGNYGDPVVARDCLAIFQYLRECNPDIHLGIHSNGGVRSIDFWRDLGRVLPKGKGYVRFGIDGLEDTNHIYRRNVRWPVLMGNVAAFIDAGGNAEWSFLVFGHNEHQVEPARELARRLGFTLFNAKRTGRFVDYEKMEYREATPIKNRDGEVVGRLERPDDPAHHNQALEGLRGLQREYGSMERYLDATEIQCKVQAGGAIYLSADGYVLPCCWLGGQIHNRGGASRQLAAALAGLGGTAHIDARRRTIREIVEDELFQRLLPEGWRKPSCAAGKPITCARVCGQGFDRRRAQNTAQRRPEAAPAVASAHPYELAEKYWHGDGVEKDVAKALDWYRQAATGSGQGVGDGRACLKLAQIYRDGEVVQKDYQRALHWYALAGDAGDSPAAQYQIGELYRIGGPGLPKDQAAAVRYYRDAAGAGMHWGQYQLGEAYRTGRGVERNADKAARLFERAARQGNHWAMLRIGDAYLEGQGVAQDPSAAARWYRRSAQKGNRQAINRLDETRDS